MALLDVLGEKENSEEIILTIPGFNNLLDDVEEKLKLFRNTEFK